MTQVFTAFRIPVRQRRRLEALATRPDYKRGTGQNLSAAIRHALDVGIETLETKRKEVTLDEH